MNVATKDQDKNSFDTLISQLESQKKMNMLFLETDEDSLKGKLISKQKYDDERKIFIYSASPYFAKIVLHDEYCNFNSNKTKENILNRIRGKRINEMICLGCMIIQQIFPLPFNFKGNEHIQSLSISRERKCKLILQILNTKIKNPILIEIQHIKAVERKFVILSLELLEDLIADFISLFYDEKELFSKCFYPIRVFSFSCFHKFRIFYSDERSPYSTVQRSLTSKDWYKILKKVNYNLSLVAKSKLFINNLKISLMIDGDNIEPKIDSFSSAVTISKTRYVPSTYTRDKLISTTSEVIIETIDGINKFRCIGRETNGLTENENINLSFLYENFYVEDKTLSTDFPVASNDYSDLGNRFDQANLVKLLYVRINFYKILACLVKTYYRSFDDDLAKKILNIIPEAITENEINFSFSFPFDISTLIKSFSL